MSRSNAATRAGVVFISINTSALCSSRPCQR